VTAIARPKVVRWEAMRCANPSKIDGSLPVAEHPVRRSQ
jgi:hypothetical protein